MVPERTTMPLEIRPMWTWWSPGTFPCMDGELATVIKVYRELRQGASLAWLQSLWPALKALIAHAMRDYDQQDELVVSFL
jgi:hypothetical protein